jgi:hypothetical protein
VDYVRDIRYIEANTQNRRADKGPGAFVRTEAVEDGWEVLIANARVAERYVETFCI